MPGSITLKPIKANFDHESPKIYETRPIYVVTLGTQKIEGPQSTSEGVHISWDEGITLQLNNEPACLVELKDKNSVATDNTIGLFQMNLKDVQSDVQSQGKFQKWYDLFNKGDPIGKVLMEASTES